jgi:cell wall-active antibiotic response 4TMS protein YvqF
MRPRFTGPVALITVGVLFLLDEFTRYSFHRTWPLILIAIGAALIAQRALPAASGSPNDLEKR